MPIKIFSHRGLVSKKSQQNKIEAFQNAYQNGFKAVEFDIWYLKNQLVLKHHRPKTLNDLDRLEDLFISLGNNVEYWLDFKNLNFKNHDLAIKKTKETIDGHNINLKNLYFAPFITDLKKAEIIYQSIYKYFGNKVKIVAVIEKLPPENFSTYYKSLKKLGIYGLSIQYENISPKFKNSFPDIEIFAWTVNDQKIADNLENIGIENIASDKPLINNANKKPISPSWSSKGKK